MADGTVASNVEAGEAGSGFVRSLWLPLDGDALLVPNTAVAEVTDYQAPMPMDEAPDWLLGVLPWRGRGTPLLRFERMLERDAATGPNERIVVLNSLSSNPGLPFIALVVSGIPRLRQVQAGMLERQALEAGEQRAALARVLLDGQPALIPDLDALEQRILAAGWQGR